MAWPRAALPQPQSLGSKYQLELYRKALIKSLLHFSVSFILLVPQVLTGLVAGSCVVSEHLSPLSSLVYLISLEAAL